MKYQPVMLRLRRDRMSDECVHLDPDGALLLWFGHTYYGHIRIDRPTARLLAKRITQALAINPTRRRQP